MGEAIRTPYKPARRRWWWRLLRGFAIAYLAVTLAVFFMQKYLIFPGASTQGQADAVLPAGHHYELLSLHARDGKKIAAIFGAGLDPSGNVRPDANDRPTIIYFYGNASCMAYSKDMFEDVRARGFNIIIPDYEGYGMSEGTPGESGCYAAADSAYDYLLTRSDVNPNKIMAVGWSLGGAMAIDLANRKPIIGVITLNAFTSLNDMARKTIPWLPTSLLLRHHFNNLAKIPNLHCPIFIANGPRDSIVPPVMSDRLAAAAGGPVTRVRIEKADHNDIFEVGGDQLFDQMQAFIEGIRN